MDCNLKDDADLVDEDGGIHIDGLFIPPPPPPSLTLQSHGPRLIITHIECENFKSYAGVKVLGPFQKNFTAVVGPNGSGKSNVIDAMLFVFGYRAQKIRSKKISVLIHDSSEHKDIQSCRVKVFFQEIIDHGHEDTFEVVPDSHFVIARSAFKDNSSYYEISDRKCLFKDVAKLLRGKGIDLDHNRFLILQGEVEQIALMKPKGQTENETGMLEYLEDIIGSSRYKEPIDILCQRVADLDEVRTEKLNRVKIVEKEKDELEKPMKEAVQHLQHINQIVERKNVACQFYVRQYTAKMQEAQSKLEEFKASSKDLTDQLVSIEKRKNEAQSRLKEVVAELSALNTEQEGHEQMFKKHEMEHSQLVEEMRSINATRKKVAAQSKAEKETYNRLLTVPETNASKIRELSELKSKLESELDHLQQKYDQAMISVRAETQEFQDKKEQLETKLVSLQQEESKKESQLNVAKSTLDLLLSHEVKECHKLEQMQLEATTSQQAASDKEAQLTELSKTFPEIKAESSKMEAKLQTLNTEYDALSRKVCSHRAHVEESKSKQTATKQRGAVHQALLNQKRAGTIPGIFGRLGDLGAIDKKYDVAISTATGSSLDTILVDDVDTAKKCIEYLKRNQVGRANLLALDKTERWKDQMKRPFKSPDNAPRLIDLISVQDESFRTAFYQYLGDTLVAQDMDQARRIAFGGQRHRVVTLSGELIETSGAMAGGGKEKLQGKMGTQVQACDISDADMAQLEAKLLQEEAQLQSICQNKTQLEKELVSRSKDMLKQEQLCEKLKLDLTQLHEGLIMLKKQIVEQQKIVIECKPDKKKVSQKQTEVAQCEKEYQAAQESSRGIKEAVAGLNKKIKDIAGSKVEIIQSKLDSVKAQMDKTKKEMTRLEVGIKSSDRDIKKSKDKLDAYDAEVKEAENKLLTMKSQRDELENQNSAIVEQLKRLKDQESQLAMKRDSFKTILEKEEAEENRCKSERIEFEQVLSRFNLSIKENCKNVQHWSRELSGLKLTDIPGEELTELKTCSEQELDELDIKKWMYDTNLLEDRVKSKVPDLRSIEEFKRKQLVYLERVSELEAVTSKRDDQRKRVHQLQKMRHNEFMEGFGIITSKLKEMYQMITLGGDAELELIDSLDPFTEGITFSVRPPKKSWKNISNLSGGEKTLSSLSLVFALHYYKPTPLYVMDEIDAALDFKNVSIVANYIKQKTRNAQFIIISLRSNMFELADRLVGIYKIHNATRSVTVDPRKIEP